MQLPLVLPGSIALRTLLGEGLKASQFHKRCRLHFGPLAWFSTLLLISGAGIALAAQTTVMSPYQGESDGTSAGGKWVEFHSEDKMTGARRVRFELRSDNYLSEDVDYKPRVEFVCTNRKYTNATFDPGMRLGPPNRPGFFGQPQIEVMVRVDGTHSYHGWNWIHGQFLSMDKGTVRGLMGARIFKVELPGRNGPEIAEFSPVGLDLARVKQACDLTPKKP